MSIQSYIPDHMQIWLHCNHQMFYTHTSHAHTKLKHANNNSGSNIEL